MSAPRVMIVEDEVVTSLLMASVLTRQGFEISGVVDDYDAAVELFEREKPDLVVMDVSIFGAIDGIDTARALLDRRAVPIVFLTAYSDTDTMARIGALTPLGCLPKPFDTHQLVQLLRSAPAASAPSR